MVRGKETKKNAFRILLKDIIPKEELELLPSRWWFIGDILITSISEELKSFGNDIGEALLKLETKRARTVLGKIGPTKGIIRKPSFKLLAGDSNTITIHKELNTLFKIDAQALTFSPGNHGERKRMIDVVSKNEFIIDMFSCIGNLSLPVAVNNQPKKIICSEINPVAFDFLQKNISLNNVKKIMRAHLGDNREVLTNYYGKADRVLSGYLHSDREQTKISARLCKAGGIIHYHEAIANKVKKKRIEEIQEIIEKERKKKIESINIKRVKKYSPGVEHLVLDIKVG